MKHSYLSREVIDEPERLAEANGALRRYGAPWKGELVLVCGKCERRLRKNGDPEGLGRLTKVLRNAADEDDLALRAVETGCLKLCPKDGIAVTTARMLAREPAEATIVRTREDVATLYREIVAGAGPLPPAEDAPDARIAD